MSRNGLGVYSLPAGTAAIPGQTISSEDFNTLTEDLANDNNTVRPVAYGGTGGGSAAEARTELDVQQLDATTTALAGLTIAANKGIYGTGPDAFATYDLSAGGRLVAATTFTDPNADRLFFWDDSEGAFAGLALGTGLSITTTTLNLSTNLQTYSGITPSANTQSFLGAADYAAMRTQLSLGTAALATIGTSGDTVPKNNTANIYGAKQTFAATSGIVVQITGANDAVERYDHNGGTAKVTTVTTNAAQNAYGAREWDALSYTFKVSGSNALVMSSGVFTYGGVAIPTISSSDTLSNKTIASAAFSGTSTGTFNHNGVIIGAGGVYPYKDSGAVVGMDNDVSGNFYELTLFAGGNADNLGRVSIGRLRSDTLAYTERAVFDLVTGNVTIPAAPTALSTNSVGLRGLGNLNGQNNAYTFALTDAAQNVYHGSGTHAYQIPPNSSVAFPIGSVIEILQDGGTLTITEGSGVTLERWDGVSGTGTRTIGAKSTAVIQKVNTNNWIIMGGSLT